MIISCEHAVRCSDNKLRCALTKRHVTTISCEHAVRYSDNKLQRFIGLQPDNAKKLQACSEIQC